MIQQHTVHFILFVATVSKGDIYSPLLYPSPWCPPSPCHRLQVQLVELRGFELRKTMKSGLSPSPILTLVVLSVLAGASGASQGASWHGPSPLIWQTSRSSNASCTLVGTVHTATTVAACESACASAAAATAGNGSCNAVNFNTDATASGARCMLVDCPGPAAQPGWSVHSWVGFAMFPVPTPPPTPPTPPPPPRLPLVVLAARAAAAGAACLDGSPPGFYWQKGSGSGADKWVVFLNGGGCE